jgi:hypothetical protein
MGLYNNVCIMGYGAPLFGVLYDVMHPAAVGPAQKCCTATADFLGVPGTQQGHHPEPREKELQKVKS